MTIPQSDGPSSRDRGDALPVTKRGPRRARSLRRTRSAAGRGSPAVPDPDPRLVLASSRSVARFGVANRSEGCRGKAETNAAIEQERA
jgi:hypothetical protein